MLDQIKIASPCSADWERMEGDERVRFCGECKKNVFNLSAMTRRGAEALLLKTNGNICARLYRRADGTVLTEDCPVGLRVKIARVRRRVGWAVAGALGFATAFGQGTGVLSGRITDAATGPIPGTSVTVTDPETQKSVEARTDAAGAFTIGPLIPGSYTIKVDAPGFYQVSRTNFSVEAGDHRFDLTLEHVTAFVTGEVVPIKPKPWWRRLL